MTRGAALCRSIGKTRVTMYISAAANIVNIIGNCVGVFVLKSGTAGVAYPSIISRPQCMGAGNIDSANFYFKKINKLTLFLSIAWNALIFAILRKIVLEIPALFVLNWLFPLYGLAYAQFTAEILLAVAAVLVLRRLFRDLERGHAPAGA